jgi:hypothetical protein
MDKIILQNIQNKTLETENITEQFSGTISDSIFKKFFLEVYSITIFTLRFSKEVVKPPYELI